MSLATILGNFAGTQAFVAITNLGNETQSSLKFRYLEGFEYMETAWVFISILSLFVDPWLLRKAKGEANGSARWWRGCAIVLIGMQLIFFLFVLILIVRSIV